MSSRIPLLLAVMVSLLFSFACGGGSIGGTKTTTNYTISVTVSGLTGTVVLQNNGGNNLSISSNGTSSFTTQIASGGAYAVTVLTQPAGQTCTLGSNASGTASSNVTVTVTCAATSATFTIGGTLSGLTSGTVVLADNGSFDSLSLSANGAFTFTKPVTGSYAVTVATQPAGLTCNVTNGSGTATANVTNVSVACAPGVTTYTIGGTLSGLASGATVVIADNTTDTLNLTTNGTFTFTTAIAAGGAYSVSVLTQPSGQSCTVTNGSGTANANVTNVAVACVSQFTISGNLTGLPNGTSITLADNGNFDSLTVVANGPFTFDRPIPAGGAYLVTVTTPPTGQTCTVTNGSGTANANVTNVAVACAATAYTIGGTLSGLTTGTLVLSDNGSFDTLSLTANGAFTFTKTITAGSTYAVTIKTQPAGQTCLVTNGSGTANANVTNVAVACGATTPLTISVAVSGINGGTLVVQDDQSAQLSFTINSTQTFSNTYASGASYSVIVFTQPTGQTCSLSSNAVGIITANVTVTATCSASGSTVTIGGTLYDLSTNVSSTGVVLQDNSADNLPLTTNGPFTFATAIANGATYNVTVFTQPTKPNQNCTVSNGSGTATSNVTNVVVVCISEWTWVNGADVVAVGGLYPGNSGGSPLDPGTRYGENTWIDGSGHFWLFGGLGYDINGPTVNQTAGGGAESVLSDLWMFDGANWNFEGGQATGGNCFAYPTAVDQAGTPSARSDSVSWIDSSGNFWMFGGYVADDVTGFCPSADAFNDMWEYTPSTNTWVWQGPLASSVQDQPGIYNGVGNAGTPGARYWSTGAQDAAGNFWMMGGYGFDSASNEGYLNDLWEWNGTTWTWMSGSSTFQAKGVYSGAGAVPGARIGANTWFDSSGDFWLFGGLAYDVNGNVGVMNDLWKFTPSSSTWTFIGGSQTNEAGANFGTQGIPNSANVPGSRSFATTWKATNGDVWLLGGQGVGGRYFNDLWKYSQGEWTWMDGSELSDQLGIYTGSASTLAPGSRQQGAAWSDGNGNIWLMGGFGLGLLPTQLNNLHTGFNSLQDLWEFQP